MPARAACAATELARFPVETQAATLKPSSRCPVSATDVDPVLERAGRVAGVVSSARARASPSSAPEAIGPDQRGVSAPRSTAPPRAGGEEVRVAPDRQRSGGDPGAVNAARDGVVVVDDFEGAETPLADVAGLGTEEPRPHSRHRRPSVGEVTASSSSIGHWHLATSHPALGPLVAAALWAVPQPLWMMRTVWSAGPNRVKTACRCLLPGTRRRWSSWRSSPTGRTGERACRRRQRGPVLARRRGGPGRGGSRRWGARAESGRRVAGTRCALDCGRRFGAEQEVAARGLTVPTTEGLQVHLVGIPGEMAAADRMIANGTLWFLHHGLFDRTRRPTIDRRWHEAWRQFRAYNACFAEEIAATRAGGRDRRRERLPPFARRRAVSPCCVPISRQSISPTRRSATRTSCACSRCGRRGARRRDRAVRCRGVPHGTLGGQLSALRSRVPGRRPPSRRRALGVDAPRLGRSRRHRWSSGRVPNCSRPSRDGASSSAAIDSSCRRTSCGGSLRSRSYSRPSGVCVIRWCSSLTSTPRGGAPRVPRLPQRGRADSCAPDERFGSSDRSPVVLEIADDHDASLAELSSFDVLLVNTLRDGMNLVAKEGAVLNRRDGVLALSREVGAFAELGGAAVAVEPFDISGTAAAIRRARCRRASVAPGRVDSVTSRRSIRPRSGSPRWRRRRDRAGDLVSSSGVRRTCTSQRSCRPTPTAPSGRRPARSDGQLTGRSSDDARLASSSRNPSAARGPATTKSASATRAAGTSGLVTATRTPAKLWVWASTSTALKAGMSPTSSPRTQPAEQPASSDTTIDPLSFATGRTSSIARLPCRIARPWRARDVVRELDGAGSDVRGVTPVERERQPLLLDEGARRGGGVGFTDRFGDRAGVVVDERIAHDRAVRRPVLKSVVPVDAESGERRSDAELRDEERDRPARDDRDDAELRGEAFEHGDRAGKRGCLVGIRDDLGERAVVVDDDSRRGRLRAEQASARSTAGFSAVDVDGELRRRTRRVFVRRAGVVRDGRRGGRTRRLIGIGERRDDRVVSAPGRCRVGCGSHPVCSIDQRPSTIRARNRAPRARRRQRHGVFSTARQCRDEAREASILPEPAFLAQDAASRGPALTACAAMFATEDGSAGRAADRPVVARCAYRRTIRKRSNSEMRPTPPTVRASTRSKSRPNRRCSSAASTPRAPSRRQDAGGSSVPARKKSAPVRRDRSHLGRVRVAPAVRDRVVAADVQDEIERALDTGRAKTRGVAHVEDGRGPRGASPLPRRIRSPRGRSPRRPRPSPPPRGTRRRPRCRNRCRGHARVGGPGRTPPARVGDRKSPTSACRSGRQSDRTTNRVSSGSFRVGEGWVRTRGMRAGGPADRTSRGAGCSRHISLMY